MTRLSTTSNPTGLTEIDKGRVAVEVSQAGDKREIQILKLDVGDLKLDPELLVVCIAKAGNTSQRFELGRIKAWKTTRFPLTEIQPSLPLRFRILVHADSDPKLIASAENVRPIGADNVESLIQMEPADLGQRLWLLQFNDTDGPVLKFNQKVFPNAQGVDSYLPFRALVLPEALRQVFEWILIDPKDLEDETTPRGMWTAWMTALGVPIPPPEEDEERAEWVDDAATRFADRFAFADMLAAELAAKGDVP